LPLSGFVRCYPEAARRKYWIALLLLSGALANAALIVAAAWMQDMGIVPKPVRDALGPIAFAQVLLIVVSVMAFRTKAEASDGLQLLQLVRGGSTEAALMPVCSAATAPLEKRHPRGLRPLHVSCTNCSVPIDGPTMKPAATSGKACDASCRAASYRVRR